MASSDTLPPLKKQIRVALDADSAFDLFTMGMSRWWPLASHSCFAESAERIEVDRCAGGAVVEHARDGRRSEWGRVIEWEPPFRFAMTWHPANDPAQATRLEVTFTAEAGQTLVTLVHSGWEARGDRAVPVRGEYDRGWEIVLGRYAAAAT
jgi:uncharacterized protein YndB with AHSA1/START domain